MSARDQFRKLVSAIEDFIAPSPLRRFTCGSCERNVQCGLPPHDDCVHKVMQIARDDDDYYPRRPSYVHSAIWPR
jgi:hypothetical protein